MNKIRLYNFATAAALGALTMVQSAHAALPDGASEAIATYKTDVVGAIGLMIAAGIAIFAVKKLGSKMGWL